MPPEYWNYFYHDLETLKKKMSIEIPRSVKKLEYSTSIFVS